MNEIDRGNELIESVDRLDREVREVYRTLVLPTWGGDLHGLPDALYGYMMGVFARIDLASAYWSGSYGGKQTERLVGFMDEFFGTDHEANSVAVQMWRHKLMHTARPRFLRHPTTGVLYRWLLHWWEHLPEEQHFTLASAADSKILNIGLVYLIQDLKAALERFQTKLHANRDARQRFGAVEQQLTSYALVLV